MYQPGESFLVTFSRWILQQPHLRSILTPPSRLAYEWIGHKLEYRGFQDFDAHFRFFVGVSLVLICLISALTMLTMLVVKVSGVTDSNSKRRRLCHDKKGNDEDYAGPLKKDLFCDDNSNSIRVDKPKDEKKPYNKSKGANNKKTKRNGRLEGLAQESKLRLRNNGKPQETKR